MELLNDIWFPHWEVGKKQVQVELPGKMLQPHCSSGLKMKPPCCCQNSMPGTHHLFCVHQCLQHQGHVCVWRWTWFLCCYSSRPKRFLWQSLVPHIAHFLNSKAQSYVGMSNDRVSSQPCILVAKEARSLLVSTIRRQDWYPGSVHKWRKDGKDTTNVAYWQCLQKALIKI